MINNMKQKTKDANTKDGKFRTLTNLKCCYFLEHPVRTSTRMTAMRIQDSHLIVTNIEQQHSHMNCWFALFARHAPKWNRTIFVLSSGLEYNALALTVSKLWARVLGYLSVRLNLYVYVWDYQQFNGVSLFAFHWQIEMLENKLLLIFFSKFSNCPSSVVCWTNLIDHNVGQSWSICLISAFLFSVTLPPPPFESHSTITVNYAAIVIKPSNIRIWIHDKDISKLTQVIWEGQGNRLRTEVSSNNRVKRFLEAVPYVMVIKYSIIISSTLLNFKGCPSYTVIHLLWSFYYINNV